MDDIRDLFRGGSATSFTIIIGIYILWRMLGKFLDDPFRKKGKENRWTGVSDGEIFK